MQYRRIAYNVNEMSFNPIAKKLVVEILFRPNLQYFDEMFKIASSIEDDYEEWRAKHNPSEGLLVDSTNKKSLKITSQSLTLITENDSIFSKLEEEVQQLFLLFLEPTKISKIRRIGVRQMGVYETSDKYAEIVSKFYDSFYANTDKIDSIAGDSVEDVAFILDGVKDGYKNHIRLGPLRPEQASMYFTSEYGELNLKKETNLYIDVDAYLDDEIDYETAKKNLKAIVANNKSIYDGFFSLAKEKLV